MPQPTQLIVTSLAYEKLTKVATATDTAKTQCLEALETGVEFQHLTAAEKTAAAAFCSELFQQMQLGIYTLYSQISEQQRIKHLG